MGGIESGDLNALVNNFMSENFQKLGSPEKKMTANYVQKDDLASKNPPSSS